jgi:predicted lactoylglutathione lyase
MAPLILGEKGVIVMLVEQNLFGNFTCNGTTDTQKGTEVLMSIDAESREEVDELARKAEEAGGTVYGKPGESDGWMYGCGFVDLDGHRWNVLFMDFEKMPK